MVRQLVLTVVAAGAVASTVPACKGDKAGPPATGSGSAAASGSAPAPAPAGDAITAMLAELGRAADCVNPASLLRVWCIAADGWPAATAAPLPDGAVAMPGLTIELATGTSFVDALRDRVSLSALAVRTDAGATFAALTGIMPTSDAETAMMAETIATLSAVFKGKAPAATVAKELADYIATLPGKASWKVEPVGAGWIWKKDTTELRKVGEYWVVIERSEAGAPAAKTGHWVSIFTTNTAPR